MVRAHYAGRLRCFGSFKLMLILSMLLHVVTELLFLFLQCNKLLMFDVGVRGVKLIRRSLSLGLVAWHASI